MCLQNRTKENIFGKNCKMNKIQNYNWHSELSFVDGVNSIGDDLIVLDNPTIPPSFKSPFRTDVVTALICTKGTAEVTINLIRHTIEFPGMIIFLSNQILQFQNNSDDFECMLIVMSQKFLRSLDINNRISMHSSLLDNPCVTLTDQELAATLNYFRMLEDTIRAKDNPNRLEVAKYLTKALFYGSGYYFHKLFNAPPKKKQNKLVDDFLKLVEINYKEYRNVDFYAQKLSLSPKYMSTVIKQNSGVYAATLINKRVILEAKVLLRTTHMTIQQISNELNFSTQSSFGKFFKRLVGLSPKEYKQNK